MKISAIRDVLRFAEYCRHDYSGHTTPEFIKADVEGKLTARIAEMRALVIAPRFASDIAFRDAEIRRCEETITRWKELRANPPAPEAAYVPGPHRCVFLGSFKCITCGAPFKPWPVREVPITEPVELMSTNVVRLVCRNKIPGVN